VHPLRNGGRVIGTLSVLSKVANDPLAGERFNDADQKVLARLADQVTQILGQVEARESARQHQRFDVLTGLPNRVHLRERLEQEISRSSQSGQRLALIRFTIEHLDALLLEQREGEGSRLVVSISEELRSGLRDFDVLARSEDETFHIIVPELESEISELLGPLARQAREAIRREPEEVADGLKLEIGYAVFPDEGQTAKALLDRAEQPRISED
jgi:diguanylate cyclase (GGDEF)-like protein